MKRISPIAFAGLVALASAGCSWQTEQEARMLVVPVRWTGQVMEYCVGTGDQLVERERIDTHCRVKVADGTEIDAWLIKSRLPDQSDTRTGDLFQRKVTRGTVVLLHPVLTGKAWFYGLGQRLADQGWDVIMMDLRGHGFSGGKYFTWGAKERHDVKAVVDHLVKTEPISDRVFACGSSMGASVAIQYAAIEPRCRGVVALAPPAGAVNIFRRILALLAEPYFEKALHRAAEMAEFDPAKASAVAAAEKLTCPLMVVHGTWDMLVPVQQGRTIYDVASGPKKFIPLTGIGHIPELGRDRWLAARIDELGKMGPQEKPIVVTYRPRGRPDMPPAPGGK